MTTEKNTLKQIENDTNGKVQLLQRLTSNYSMMYAGM